MKITDIIKGIFDAILIATLFVSMYVFIMVLGAMTGAI